jgi:hypothetical protein
MNESCDNKLGVSAGVCGLALFCFCGLLGQAQPQTLKQPTFYRDVLSGLPPFGRHRADGFRILRGSPAIRRRD